ncbi:MAG: hypothetical protein WBH73_08820 [Arcanobacterium sp.]
MAGDFFAVRRGATAVPNSLVHNKELSYQALALLVVVLSMPPGARVGYRDLKGRGMGEKATRMALRELEELNYRFRFTHRREGKLRDLTVVSDVPLTPSEAMSEAQQMMKQIGLPGSRIVACPSHPDFVFNPDPIELAIAHDGDKTAGRTVPHGEAGLSTGELSTGSYRAATGAARCDQPKHPVSAGRTVQCSTEARWSAAQVSKDTSKESIDSLIHQPTTEDVSGAARVSRPDLKVVGGSEDQSNHGDGAPSGLSPDWKLIARCVPLSHRKGLMGKAAHRVSELIDRLLVVGWTPHRIHERLADNPLPPAVHNPPGLLISRLNALGELPVPSQPAGVPRNHFSSNDSPSLPVLSEQDRVEARKAAERFFARMQARGFTASPSNVAQN